MLPKYLDKLLERPRGFDPTTVRVSDRGSIAMTEMNNLSTRKKLFMVGGGNFQDWKRDQFKNVTQNIC